MSKQFYFKQFSLTEVKLDQGSMAIKGYSAFPIAPVILGNHHQIV